MLRMQGGYPAPWAPDNPSTRRLTTDRRRRRSTPLKDGIANALCDGALHLSCDDIVV